MSQKWNYTGYPIQEFDFVRSLVKEIRKVRQEYLIDSKMEISIQSDNCPLTEAGKDLLKKLVNAKSIEKMKDLPEDQLYRFSVQWITTDQIIKSIK